MSSNSSCSPTHRRVRETTVPEVRWQFEGHFRVVGPHPIPPKPFEDLEEWEQEKVEWVGADFDPEDFSPVQARHDLVLSSAWGMLKRKR